MGLIFTMSQFCQRQWWIQRGGFLRLLSGIWKRSVDTGLHKGWEYKPHWLVIQSFFHWLCVQTMTVETKSCQNDSDLQNCVFCIIVINPNVNIYLNYTSASATFCSLVSFSAVCNVVYCKCFFLSPFDKSVKL